MKMPGSTGWIIGANTKSRRRAALSKNPKSGLAKIVGKQIGGEAKYLNAALRQKDPLARKILDETAEDLIARMEDLWRVAKQT